MDKFRGCKVEEFFYDSREERDNHVQQMESNGWECSGQIKYMPLLGEERDWKWYAKFSKLDTDGITNSFLI